MSANKIVLNSNGLVASEEAIGSGTIKPGHLIAVTTAGAVIVHTPEGGFAERAFATEDANQGNTVDTSYANGARVMYACVAPGTKVQARLAAGENVTAIGTQLISNGDGTLIALASAGSGVTVRQIIAVAMEVMNATSAEKFIAVRVL